MLSDQVSRVRVPHILDVATYLSVAAMTLLGISGLPSLWSQLLALTLALVFVLLYRFVFRSGRYEQNPSLYFGAQAATLGLLFLLGSQNSDAFNFLFLLLTIHTALVLTAKQATVWITIYYGIVSSMVLLSDGVDGLYAILFYLIIYVVCGFFGYVLQQAELARDRNQRLVEELQATQQKLQELAVLEERNRLARDLHDSVKQQVFAISMQLSAARASLDETDSAYPSVVQAEKLAQQAGTELTTMIQQLRPPYLESRSLAAALHDYVREWSRQNSIETELNLTDHLSLSVDAEQALFRVGQEALSNIARHSHATKAIVTLKEEESEILLSIEDNGQGLEQGRLQEGVGLHSMQERMSHIGGTLQVSSQKDGGTRVTARLRRS